VRKLRNAEAMQNAGKDLAAVLQSLEVTEATFHCWRAKYGVMKADEAFCLKKFEDENNCRALDTRGAAYYSRRHSEPSLSSSSSHLGNVGIMRVRTR
jgi:hypothetical protein